jgi:competence protein ComEA
LLRELRDWAEELACRAGFDGLPASGRVAGWAAAAIAVCVAGTLWWSGVFSSGGADGSLQAAAPSSARASMESSGGAEPAMAATVTVHVVGEVRRPGVYELAGGSRAIDAIEAAGGLLGAADQSAVNLARVVADGEQIAVPRQGQGAPTSGSAGASSGARSGKIDLNTATEAQLDTLPGVGPATASKIVSDRNENGPFRTVDDLLRVPGIGPAKFDALKDLVTAG